MAARGYAGLACAGSLCAAADPAGAIRERHGAAAAAGGTPGLCGCESTRRNALAACLPAELNWARVQRSYELSGVGALALARSASKPVLRTRTCCVGARPPNPVPTPQASYEEALKRLQKEARTRLAPLPPTG